MALTVAAQREGPNLARQRALLLRNIQAEIKRQLDNRLPERHQRICLSLTSQPQSVLPRPGLRLEQPHSSCPIPPDKSIDTVFREAGDALLILGAPGAGKTTLLLELAEALAEEARQQKNLPVPIVLPLDTWAQHKGSLEEWFAREASRVYGIGIDLARTWVEHDALIPLLDGLDEIGGGLRDECVRAINTFRTKHGTLPIAVCSRTAGYGELKERLALTTAAVIEPLTEEQISDFLEAGGAAFAGLAQARKTMPELRELLTTPLMLSVAAAAFADRTQQALLAASAGDAQRRLWSAYVKRMLERTRQGRRTATDERILRHLAWLARAMHRRSLSVFYIERLQPDWLPDDRANRMYRALSGLAVGVILGLAGGLAGVAAGALAFGWAGGVVGGVAGGLIIGLSIGMAFGLDEARALHPSPYALFAWRRFLVVGLSGALTFGLAFGLESGLAYGLAGGLVFGLTLGFVGGILRFAQSVGEGIIIVEMTSWSWKRALASILIFGLIFGVVGMLSVDGKPIDVIFGLAYGLAAMLVFGLNGNQMSDSDRQRPNEGIHRSAQNALRSGIIGATGAPLLFALGVLVNQAFEGANTRLALETEKAVFLMPVFFVIAALINGGVACIRHVALRIALWHTCVAPWNYAALLNNASDRLLMRRVGGGFAFWRLRLRDFLAGLSEEELRCVTSKLEYLDAKAQSRQ